MSMSFRNGVASATGYDDAHTKGTTQNTFNGLEEIPDLSPQINYMSGYS